MDRSPQWLPPQPIQLEPATEPWLHRGRAAMAARLNLNEPAGGER